MKTTVKYITLICALCFLFIVGLISGDKTAAQSNQESANGHGTVMVKDQNGKDVRRQFSFSARKNADGTVNGTAVVHNPAFTGAKGNSSYRANFDISCLKVVGNIAIMGGSVKSTNDPNLTTAAFFTVQDNGEPGKDRDMISSVFFSDGTNTPADCEQVTTSDFPLMPIEAGNIQVRNGSNP